MGFWRRLEARLIALQRDRPRAARYVQVAWWISNLFLLFGVVVVFLMLTGKWRP